MKHKKILLTFGIVAGLTLFILFSVTTLFSGFTQWAYITYLNSKIRTEFEVKDNELWMNKEINSKTYNQFVRILEKNPQVDTLVEVNVPGSIDDDTMIRLGYYVRKKGLKTKLLPHSSIDSGGVDLYLAGVERIMEIAPGGKIPHIGVHSWGDGINQAKDYPKDAPEHVNNCTYIEKMLGRDDFYWYTIYAAPADGIHEMSLDEIKKYGLVTEYVYHSAE